MTPPRDDQRPRPSPGLRSWPSSVSATRPRPFRGFLPEHPGQGQPGFPRCPSCRLLPVLLVSLLALPPSAHAADPTVRLEVRSPLAGCPDAPTLSRAINAILGRAALGDTPDGPSLSIAFEKDPGGFKSTLSLRAAGGALLGTRELHRPGRGCAALEGPVAVVGALLVDIARDSIQLQVPPPSPGERAAVADEPPAPSLPGPSPAAPPTAATPAPPPRWSLQGELAATAILGLLPGVTPGIRSDLRASRGGGLAGVSRLDFWPSRSSSGAGPGGDFTAGAASLGLCATAYRSPSLALEGCGLALLGGLQGVGRGTREVRVSRSWLVLGVLDGAVRGRLGGPLWGRLGLGVAAGHRPGRFLFEGPGQELEVHRTWPVAFLATLGLVLDDGS